MKDIKLKVVHEFFKMENMALRVKLLALVPKKNNEGLASRTRRMIQYAIDNGLIK